MDDCTTHQLAAASACRLGSFLLRKFGRMDVMGWRMDWAGTLLMSALYHLRRLEGEVDLSRRLTLFPMATRVSLSKASSAVSIVGGSGL